MENLIRFEDMTTYKQVLKDFRSKGDIIYQNFSMFPNEVKKLVLEGKLFYQVTEHYLAIFAEKSQQIELFVSIRKENQSVLFLPREVSQSIVLNCVCQKEDEQTVHAIETMLGSDFDVTHKNQEMLLKQPDQLPASLLKRDETVDFTKATLEDSEEIRRIWVATLDPVSNPIPTKEEYVGMLPNIFKLVLESEIVGAVYVSEVMGKRILEHVSINPSYQGKGYGNEILKQVIQYQEKPIALWVNVLNDRAIALYKKFQMEETGIISYQYHNKN